MEGGRFCSVNLGYSRLPLRVRQVWRHRIPSARYHHLSRHGKASCPPLLTCEYQWMLLSSLVAYLKHVCKLEVTVRIFRSFLAYGVERSSCYFTLVFGYSQFSKTFCRTCTASVVRMLHTARHRLGRSGEVSAAWWLGGQQNGNFFHKSILFNCLTHNTAPICLLQVHVPLEGWLLRWRCVLNFFRLFTMNIRLLCCLTSRHFQVQVSVFRFRRFRCNSCQTYF